MPRNRPASGFTGMRNFSFRARSIFVSRKIVLLLGPRSEYRNRAIHAHLGTAASSFRTIRGCQRKRVRRAPHLHGPERRRARPWAGLVIGKDGVLYGATALGGIADGGMVFALYPPASAGAWTERVLYRFEVQGGLLPVPNGDLAIGKDGAIFGTTAHGGIFAPLCSDGCGLVFGLYPPSAGGAWTAKVLYSFGGGSDGAGPLGGLAIGPEGGLYGATAYGGDLSCKPPIGCGTAFQLVP